jgi:hypothetical protein
MRVYHFTQRSGTILGRRGRRSKAYRRKGRKLEQEESSRVFKLAGSLINSVSNALEFPTI